MEVVMCLDCGHFQPALRRDGSIEPVSGECERCGGTSLEPANGE
jgi:ribosomal protein S27E